MADEIFRFIRLSCSRFKGESLYISEYLCYHGYKHSSVSTFKSHCLVRTSDSIRKTAIIDAELGRLDVDIAALQGLLRMGQ